MKRKHLNKSVLALVLSAGITLSSLPWDMMHVQAADSAGAEETSVVIAETETESERTDLKEPEAPPEKPLAEEEEPPEKPPAKEEEPEKPPAEEETPEKPPAKEEEPPEKPPTEEEPPGEPPAEEKEPGKPPTEEEEPERPPAEEEEPEKPPTEEEKPPEKPPAEENPEENPEENLRQEYVTASFAVCWDDGKNLADRRGEKITDILEIYGDGVLLDNSLYEIRMDGEKQETADGLEIYHYTIAELPFFQEDLKTPVSYALGEKEEKLPGYEKLQAKIPTQEELKGEAAKPSEKILLESSEKGLTGKKYFGNYLPEYQVSGKVLWDDNGNQKGIRPDAEAYFEKQFVFLQNQEAYPYTRIICTQDDAEPDQWTFTVKGLFETDKKGTPAVYTWIPGSPEGYQSDGTETGITRSTNQLTVTFACAEADEEIQNPEEEKKDEEIQSPEEEKKDEEKQNPEEEKTEDEETAPDDSEREEPEEHQWIPGREELFFTGELMEDIDSDLLDLMEAGVVWSTFAGESGEGQDLSNAVKLTKINVKIDGKDYTGGDITITKGTSFAYEVEWQLNATANEGDSFSKKIFRIPGLNIKSQTDIPAVIYTNGRSIRIGTMSMDYNKTTGELKFSMEFSQYAAVFQNIQGYKSGAGSFGTEGTWNGGIVIGEYEGTLEVKTEEEKPKPPTNPGGTGVGWTAPKPPEFNNKTYAFGKGKKWNSSNPPYRIEWRVVLMEELQKRQSLLLDENRELLGGNGRGSVTEENLENINKQALSSASGYYIIEDTLDENQKFVRNPQGEGNYQWSAPFFFEIPLVVAGTGNILLNGGFGNGGYDGPGLIYQLIQGNVFTEVNSEAEVRSTPMTWAVVKVTESNGLQKEKLIVNIGKLGETDGSKGLVYKGAELQTEIDKQISDAQKAIRKLKNGSDSPAAALYEKNTSLKNYLSNREWNTEASGSAFEQFETWFRKYFGSIENKVSATNQEQITALREIQLIQIINEIAEEHEELKEQQVYTDWKKHLDNFALNQNLYADNHQQYLDNWEYALGRYQMTKVFYEGGRVFGFCLKYMVDIVNPTAGTYSNHVRISTQEKSYEAEDTVNIGFQIGITGNFPTGSAVFKKADSVCQYDSTQNNRLAGAKFKVYCADGGGTGWYLTQDDEHLGVFAGKDASATQNAYVWSHHVGDPPDVNTGIISTEKGLTVLESDETGTLAITGLDAAHPHYLVETEAPEGYYLDPTPVQFQINSESMLFQDVFNIARGVKIKKASSYDSSSVQGAEFALYTQDDKFLEGGFTKKTIIVNDVTTWNYWYDKNASNQTLSTFENGELKILGLPAGSYYLKETKAAPGYVLSEEQKEQKYSFTLPEEITAEYKKSLIYENGFYYAKAVDSSQPPETVTTIFNDQKTKDMTLTKVGQDLQPLSGAEFALFRWKGTEAEWKQDPTQQNLWEAVSVTGENALYFRTENEVNGTALVVDEDGTLTIQGIPNGHYAIEETAAPEGYVVLRERIYFDVDVSNEDRVQLYWDAKHEKAIQDNRVPNYLQQGSLTLYKLVSGSYADLTKSFAFTVALKDAEEKPVSGQFDAVWFTQTEGSEEAVVTKNGSVTFDANGECRVSLSHEQGITIKGLPAGAKYQVTEDPYEGYQANMDKADGTIEAGKTVRIQCTNTLNSVPSTGISDRKQGSRILLGSGAAAILLLILLRFLQKRRTQL